jgi:hypothetical protein
MSRQDWEDPDRTYRILTIWCWVLAGLQTVLTILRIADSTQMASLGPAQFVLAVAFIPLVWARNRAKER